MQKYALRFPADTLWWKRLSLRIVCAAPKARYFAPSVRGSQPELWSVPAWLYRLILSRVWLGCGTLCCTKVSVGAAGFSYTSLKESKKRPLAFFYVSLLILLVKRFTSAYYRLLIPWCMPGDGFVRQVDVLSRVVETASMVRGSRSSRRNIFAWR